VIRRCALLAMAALVACACAGEGSAPRRRSGPCTASEAVVDAYSDRVGGLITDALSDVALARFEQVTIALEVDAGGSPSHVSVISASTPLAAESARAAVRAAAPFPPPPFDFPACLYWGRIQLSLYSSGRCDEPAADQYLDRVVRAVQDAVEKREIAAKYDGDVVLRIDVARNGAVESVIVQSADSEPAGAAVANATRALARFEPPGELIQDCVADGPFLVWIPLTELPQ
jgi:hypothetical protein